MLPTTNFPIEHPYRQRRPDSGIIKSDIYLLLSDIEPLYSSVKNTRINLSVLRLRKCELQTQRVAWSVEGASPQSNRDRRRERA